MRLEYVFNFKFVLIRPDVAVKCATEGLVALEGVDSSILWPADITTIPGTDSNSLRFNLERLSFQCEKKTFCRSQLEDLAVDLAAFARLCPPAQCWVPF